MGSGVQMEGCKFGNSLPAVALVTEMLKRFKELSEKNQVNVWLIMSISATLNGQEALLQSKIE